MDAFPAETMVEQCKVCRRSFDSPAELLAHVARAHPKGTPARAPVEEPAGAEGNYHCNDCGVSFAAEAELVLHTNRHHVGIPRQ